jgi:hypothetical protein
MIDFLNFMLKCFWHGSSYVFSSAPSVEPEEPFAILGLIGFIIFAVSFGLLAWFLMKSESNRVSRWFVAKVQSVYMQVIVSMLCSFIPSILYFFIAYCFV